MSFVQNPRVECGKILQNHNGQYFFVCSTCELEFVTLSSFLNHQNDAHDTKEFQKQSDELTIPFTKNVGRKIKESIMGSKDLGVSFTEQKNAMREIKDDKDSSDSMDDCAEHVNKIKALLRSVSNSEPRRTILVSPKAKKPARNIVPSFRKKETVPGGGRYSSIQVEANRIRTTEETSGKYKCKNCSATFTTMVNLDSHEVICMILPMGMRFYCDRCNHPFDDKSRLQTHKKLCHRS